MTALELSSLLTTADGARLLDVRTPAEFENAHIRGAYNVPLDRLHEHASEVRTAPGAVVLICQSGQRAQRAEAVLRSAGMGNMHVLDGGMKAWLASGLPVNRVRARMSLERQVRILAGVLAAVGAIGALTISPLLAVVPAAIGSGLVFAGITDTCAMGMLLARLPYNRGAAACDTETIVRQFLAGEQRPL
ncbi:MAG TPA: rhodanese-like domain-containing protein [Vicinamibacterales bacterium]|nr:rhodanese-like domain-containing protein [Vicinamibacterales bacterium]